MRRPGAQPPEAWQEPPAFRQRALAETCQIIDGDEHDEIIAQFVPTKTVRFLPTAVRVVKAFKTRASRARYRIPGGSDAPRAPFLPLPLAHRPPPCPPRYQGSVCRQFKCEQDDCEAAFWVRFDGDNYFTKIDTESLKSGGITFLVLLKAVPARAAT